MTTTLVILIKVSFAIILDLMNGVTSLPRISAGAILTQPIDLCVKM
jgi:hypothetical protein